MNRNNKSDIEAGTQASEQRAPGATSPKTGAGVTHKSLRLPHERDQSTDAVEAEPQAVIVQAKKDLDRGLVDTDMRATPGLDAQRREDMVPNPVAPARPAAPKGGVRKGKPARP